MEVETKSATKSGQNALEELRNDVQHLLELQAAVLRNPAPDSLAAVASHQESLRMRTAALIQEVSIAWRSTVLEPSDIDQARECVQDLGVLQRQLDILTAELQTPAGQVPQVPLASLLVKRQPFPLVLRKGELLSESDAVVVRLVSSSNSVMTVASQVRLHVLAESGHRAAVGAQELLDPISVPLDPATLSAKFPLRFLDGTKNAPVTLRFSVQVTLPNGVSTFLESEPTAPMIVTTHKDQWKGAAGSLLKREAFLNQAEVPWEQVANTIQAHFLRATKQPAASAHRPLSMFDVMYLRKKWFGNAQVVEPAVFDSFWAWFGATLDTLRHQRPILNLWWQGLVYGFATKEDVDVALGGQPHGTFIVRFSETCAGSFAIAYASPEGVKHYLVTPQDHALHKTLPDFIVSQPQFAEVLQLQSSHETPGSLQLARVPKSTAYEPFCSKKAAPARSFIAGYSDLAH